MVSKTGRPSHPRSAGGAWWGCGWAGLGARWMQVGGMVVATVGAMVGEKCCMRKVL